MALPSRPALPPFSARPAGSNSSAGLKQQQDGKALQWASEEMKGDRELCTAAVAQRYEALEYAAHALRSDVDVVRTAVKPGRQIQSTWNPEAWLRKKGVPDATIRSAM